MMSVYQPRELCQPCQTHEFASCAQPFSRQYHGSAYLLSMSHGDDDPNRHNHFPPLENGAGHVGTTNGEEDVVAQMLEIARESEEGARNATVGAVLESALSRTWAKVLAEPDVYVMTRDEFSLFNYFQHRFAGNEVAMAARKRYWDATSA